MAFAVITHTYMQDAKIILKRQVCHGRSLQNICMAWSFKKFLTKDRFEELLGLYQEDISVRGQF